MDDLLKTQGIRYSNVENSLFAPYQNFCLRAWLLVFNT